MKKFIAVAAFALLPMTSFAQPIALQPGSSIVVDGEIISCLGPSDENLAPLCSIRQDGSNHRVYIGENIASSYYNFNDALRAAKELKAAGICR